MIQWTIPFCGVTHIVRDRVLVPFQFTAFEYETFVEAYVLSLMSGNPFTPVYERTFRGDNALAEAKAWLTHQYTVLAHVSRIGGRLR